MAENSSKFQKKRKGQLVNVSSVLHGLFEKQNNPLSEQFLRWKLWYNWKEIVGEAISQKCIPVGYKDGMLWVWTQNSSWMHHLMFMREEMIHAINTKVGKKFVRAIRFTLDRHEVPVIDDPDWQKLLDKVIPQSDSDNKI